MSTGSLHQLHIFIFVLAVFHVTYSVIIMALSRLKMRTWKKWETETASLEYQFANDPARFRFTHQTSFVKRHLGLSSTPGIRWVVAFFRQFFRSVTKVDYLTLRAGFINAHLSHNSKFDFHKYIKRSMEDDFKVVVGISLPLWCVAILTLFLDIDGIGTLTWISFIPLVILLCVGTKLEMIIMEMALEIQDRASVIKGAPVVEPSNKFFWFHRPDWVLFFIHLTLFQNAFQMAHFVWTVATPGLKKCFHMHIGLSIMKVVLGLALQFLCSYITFPLYALVTQVIKPLMKMSEQLLWERRNSTLNHV
uniref:MLO-like protein n=1 Tax=Aegilops tauschii subsp. strangulata TaxID=200361 RepID=A0A453J1G2_AEGTS